jgi:hypothetical protein
MGPAYLSQASYRWRDSWQEYTSILVDLVFFRLALDAARVIQIQAAHSVAVRESIEWCERSLKKVTLGTFTQGHRYHGLYKFLSSNFQ